MFLNTIKRYATDKDYRIVVNTQLGFYNNMPDDVFLSKRYKTIFGKELNLENPTTFNEKTQYLKLYNRKPEYTMMADKYRVREYIKNKIGEEYLIPLLGVWDRAEDIDFSALPDKFVLKCNHNSGTGMCICKNKSELNIKRTVKELKKGLKENYYLFGREWPYKDIKRKIIAEKFMVDPKHPNQPLEDYKFLCFNGKVKLIEHHIGRFTGNYTQDFYDDNWNKTFFSNMGVPISEGSVPCPANFEKMKLFSEKLAVGTPFVRIDWYDICGKLYFGEITFFDGSGFYPWTTETMDIELGSWIELPEKGFNLC